METKREILSKLLDNQLDLVATLQKAARYSTPLEESERLLNAILGVEGLTNAIAALPLTTEEKAQKRDRASSKSIEQCSVQEALNGWQPASDRILSNREPTHSFDDDDSGW